jgi:hypothetical protein
VLATTEEQAACTAEPAYLCHAKVLDARVEVVAADGILAALGNARHAPLVLELGGPATGYKGRVRL